MVLYELAEKIRNIERSYFYVQEEERYKRGNFCAYDLNSETLKVIPYHNQTQFDSIAGDQRIE